MQGKISGTGTLIFVGFFLVLALHAFGQENGGIIKGQIIGADGKPVSNVNLALKNLSRKAVTNNTGLFIFMKLPVLKDTLVISSIDSRTIILPVAITQGQTLDIGSIKLEPKVQQLQSVEINGRRSLSYRNQSSFFGKKTEAALKDIPQAISTVTGELMQDKMELTLKDALNDIAGVNQYSGFDEYTIRGFRAENARDIDGLRGYNSTYTSNMLVNIERIEVIKGPTATLYGNGDPGGTINLVTKKPLDTMRAAINIYRGTWNHTRAIGDITGPLNQQKTMLFRFNAGFDHTNSFVNQLYANSYQFAPSLTYVPNDRLKLNVNFSLSNVHTMLNQGQPGTEGDNNLQSTPIGLTLSQPGDFLHETDFATIISGSYKLSKSLTYNFGYLNYITRQSVASHGFNGYSSPDSVSLFYTTFRYHTNTSTLTNYLTYNIKTGSVSHQFLAGFDFIKSSVDLKQQYFEQPQFGTGKGIVGVFSLTHSQYVPRPVSTYQVSGFDNDESNVDGNIYHTLGFYIQDEAKVGKWNFLGSLREEHYLTDDGSSLNESVFLPRLGIVYAILPDLSVYGTFNNGFDAFEASTGAQIFNSPLKPNTSHLMETGIKGNFFKDRLFASLAVYQLLLRNVAVNANDPSNPNLFVQQGENRSRGIEFEANGNVLPNLSVDLSYAYCMAKVTQSKISSQIGMPVANAPKFESGSWIKYSFRRGFLKGFGLSFGHSQVGERATLDPAFNLPSYFVINGGIHYRLKNYRLALNLYNLTNQVYWQGAYNNINKWPGQPRNVMFNLGLLF